jgi:hypothetical protein
MPEIVQRMPERQTRDGRPRDPRLLKDRMATALAMIFCRLETPAVVVVEHNVLTLVPNDVAYAV